MDELPHINDSVNPGTFYFVKHFTASSFQATAEIEMLYYYQ